MRDAICRIQEHDADRAAASRGRSAATTRGPAAIATTSGQRREGASALSGGRVANRRWTHVDQRIGLPLGVAATYRPHRQREDRRKDS